MTAIALTVAGSDPSGGAGIQADLKTFSALGVYGAAVLTSLTAQNTRGVQGIQDIPAAFVTEQIESVLSDLHIGAVKVGMLSRADIIDAVADAFEARPAIPLVLDPVMVATSGDALLRPDAVDRLRRRLLPLALCLTPNIPEAAALLEEPAAENEDEMVGQARRLLALGCRSVLIKGGHAHGAESVDVLVEGESVTRLPAPRVETRHTHGTGCTLSSAIAAGLAKGEDLAESAQGAKRYVAAAIAAAGTLRIGHGSGPVHHFHHWWE